MKALLVYANSMMDNLIPLNISYLTACLKEQGIDVKLFDTTFYRTAEMSSDEARVRMLQVRPFDLSKYGINYKDSDVFEDFKKEVSECKPDLIGFSVVETTYPLAEKLLDSIKDIKGDAKVIFGGVFAIFAYERIMKNTLVDMVCLGEGERTLPRICEAISEKKPLHEIGNLAVRVRGNVRYNSKSSLVDLNNLPFLDFSLFEKERFFKPMGGRVLKMVPVEFARGCPYTCTYCASPALAENFKKCGKWFRQKRMRRIIEEIEFYLKKYNTEYFYFISESFLNIKESDFKEFIDYYKSVKVPFWFNTRIETISSERIRKLENVNCNRISIGLESGSESIRRRLLKRNYSNDFFVEKFNILKNHGISVSVNNIIGFPDETRENIFETIELNRRIKAESFGAYIFQPFHGTLLRDYCVRKRYVSEDYLAGDVHCDSNLNTAHITKEEIIGLQRTFSLYVTLPEEYRSDIKIAEKSDEKGNKKFKDLSAIYYKYAR